MSEEAKSLLPILIPITSTLLGTIIGMVGTIVITKMHQKSEERKQIIALAFNAGIENWKEASNWISRRGKGVLEPLEHFIINMKYLADNLLYIAT